MAPNAALLALYSILATAMGQSCFYPDGTQATQDIPCMPMATHACCPSGFTCLPNGLCANPSYNGSAFDVTQLDSLPYIRSSCTDQKWQSPLCPNFCTDQTAEPSLNVRGGFVGLSHCPNTTEALFFCIDSNGGNVDCAGDVGVVSLNASPAIQTLTGSTSASSLPTGPTSTAGAVTSSTSLETPTFTPPVEPTGIPVRGGHSNNHLVAMGLAIGFWVGAIALALLGWVLYMRRSRRNAVKLAAVQKSLERDDSWSDIHVERHATELTKMPSVEAVDGAMARANCS